jgi:dihydropteroate synthase
MSVQGTNFKSKFRLRANGKVLNLSTPAVMGIINLTPDSFYDGGKVQSQSALLELAEKHVRDGAAILDLGAVSTKPGAPDVSEDEELRRLLAALKLIRNTFPDIFISVDTYRSVVALAAAESGADMINDISAGTFDSNMLLAVAQTRLPYCIMHMQGRPATMQKDPKYKNVVSEVYSFLSSRMTKAKKAGIKQVVLDPGFGFGKTADHNYRLLSALKKFSKLRCPILAGVSRKSMINKIIGTKPENALNGTTVVHTLALLNSANILRTHDVKEAVQAVRLVEAYFKNS